MLSSIEPRKPGPKPAPRYFLHPEFVAAVHARRELSFLAARSGFPSFTQLSGLLNSRTGIAATPLTIQRLEELARVISWPRTAIFVSEETAAL